MTVVSTALRRGAARLRRHVRKLWESRGGGFYGLVGALTFLYLEAVDLAGDLAGIRPADIDVGWAIGFMVDNLVEAVTFGIQAALWPLAWVRHFGLGLTSGALLLGAYGLYRLTRPAVLRLLAEPPEPAPDRIGR